MSNGDCAGFSPCKNGLKGIKYGNSPVPSAYHPTRPINLAREAARYEVMRAAPEALRRQSPLVLGPGSRSWGKVALGTFFKELTRNAVPPERARPLVQGVAGVRAPDGGHDT